MRLLFFSVMFFLIYFCGVIYADEVIWNKKLTVGYDRSAGNTDSSQMNASVFINRNHKYVNEMMLKGDAYYSSSDKKMDAQKWYGMGRYAFSFGGKKWYNFYKFEADHDRFTNVDYRLVPSAGLGYWFSDLDEFKALTEVSIGSEHTNYRDTTPDSDEAIFISRVFIEKTIFENSKISQDAYWYPALEDFGDYRVHAETVFTTSLSENLSLNFSFIDDYDSEPAGDTKKNDTRFISSMSYSF
ncbi:YdiY family protein [Candidatus Omnitrophota bacterium]